MSATRIVPDHQRLLGRRLRSIRHQQRMSLADVQARSEGRWKAVVVGAYERGDRTITIGKLQELAAFYGVPLADLLPAPRSADGEGQAKRYVLDLVNLRHAATNGERDLLPVARFAAQVRRHRGDHNGRVMTVRSADLEMLALTTGQETQALIERMRRDGALLDVA